MYGKDADGSISEVCPSVRPNQVCNVTTCKYVNEDTVSGHPREFWNIPTTLNPRSQALQPLKLRLHRACLQRSHLLCCQ